MTLSKNTIRHIANLAKLQLSREEEDLFARQLGDVLDSMNVLEELDTDDVAPTNQVTGLRNVFRDDVVRPYPKPLRRKLLREVPKLTDEYVAVPHAVHTSS